MALLRRRCIANHRSQARLATVRLNEVADIVVPTIGEKGPRGRVASQRSTGRTILSPATGVAGTAFGQAGRAVCADCRRSSTTRPQS